MFKKLSLGLKFIVILAIVFVTSMGLSGVLFSATAHHQAEDQVAANATMLIEMVNAVRNYTNIQVQPLLINQIDSSEKFVREAIPSYAARQTFELLRRQKQYSDYFYKDAALNPTNPRDQANEFEAALVREFRQNPDLKERSGFKQGNDRTLFYVARPLKIQQQSCLRCHSTPDQAPQSQLATYGTTAGFGWEMNQIVAAQTVYVTAEEVFQSYQHQLLLMLGTFAGIFALVLLLINILLNRMVIQPIIPMARITRRISLEESSTALSEATDLRKLDKVAQRSDELGQLAGLFRQMTSVIFDREQSMQQLVQKLRYETDNAKRAMAAVRSSTGINVTELIQRSRRSRSVVTHHQADLNSLLRLVPAFQGFSEADLERLVQLGYQVELPAQDIICREDELGNTFYIILSGAVEFYVTALNKHLRTQHAGTFFGELALLLGMPRTATARTVEPTVLFAINQAGLQTLLQEHTDLAETMTQQLNIYKAELEQRKDFLHRHDLLHDEKTFSYNFLGWVRDRIHHIFGV
ncbi:MAG TPA: DUF3365 domain-containing protein [Microcoleaceae cyanobacterium]